MRFPLSLSTSTLQVLQNQSKAGEGDLWLSFNLLLLGEAPGQFWSLADSSCDHADKAPHSQSGTLGSVPPSPLSHTGSKVFTWAHFLRVELAVLSGEEKRALTMKAPTVTEVFITLGSNGMQVHRVKWRLPDHLGKTGDVIVFSAVPHLPFSVSQLPQGWDLYCLGAA